jgi:SNF2 family DNA or RNA helicase
MKNVTILYAPEVEAAINWHLTAPKWSIDLTSKHITLKPGPRHNTYDVQNVPGIVWHREQGHFTLPLPEAWRVFEALKEVEGVVYSEDAKAFIMKQVEARAAIDSIGKAKDWQYDVDLKNGITLRPVQRVGCAFLEATGGRALLAYQMGMGKTVISMAYVHKNKYKTLIVCPASLKNNWARQILKITGERAVVLMGSVPEKHDLVTLLTSDHKYYIINYDILGKRSEFKKEWKDQEGYKHEENVEKFMWVDVLNMAKFDVVISDESHYIKNTDSNRSQAVRKLSMPRVIHMTGTPVLNRPGELWPMLTMIDPESFPSEEGFIRNYTYDGKTARNVEELKNSLKSIMIRRKQSDVMDDLPELNRMEDYHELSTKARKLYSKILDGVYEEIAAYSAAGMGEKERKVTSILAQIMRLKQVCAIDKVDSTAELAIQLHESAENERHNKVLIFSQFKATAYAIAQRLGHEALCFVSRGPSEFKTADMNERDRLVQQFQTDPKIKYLVVTEKTAKEGHDITEAGFVIFNDLFWTPAAHDQGEGRAYMRMIDPHGISAYYRIVDMNGEGIEEWIWELLDKKTGIINSTVEGVEDARGDVSVAMALIEKMKEKMWSRGK